MKSDNLDKILGRGRKRLVLELTYACNSACYNCSTNSHLKKAGSSYMNLDATRKAIDYALQYGIDYVLFTGGEPTLVSYLPTIVDYAHSKGMKTRVNTNGWKNNSQYWKDLEIRGLDYTAVSIDSSHNLPEINRRPIPLENALETLEIMINVGIETVVPIIPYPGSEKDDMVLYKYLKDMYRKIGDTTNGYMLTELVVNERKHLIAFNDTLNYNGRTRKIYFPTPGRCPSRIDLENSFFVRVNPNNEIRVPCASYQQLKIKPYLFNPEDNESLMGDIRRLQANQEFLDFLKTGKGIGENDVCDFCIREYLNK